MPPSSQAPEIIVVGCGVVGLSCAARLAEAGKRVAIWTAALPEHTTSHVAAAFWHPYRIDPIVRASAWAGASYRVFVELAADPRTGVQLRTGVELFPTPIPDPPWAAAVDGFRHARPDELRLGRTHGIVFEAPVIDMPVYLPWLLARVRSLGVEIVERPLDSLTPALDQAPLVVDAAGLAARELVGDRELYAVRGQIVVCEQIGLDRVWLDEHDEAGTTYIIPRTRDIVMGGVADEHDERLGEDPEQTEAIVRRCVAIEPRLAHAKRIGVRVGLRPCRSSVRLELERLPEGRRIIHDYGHGGAGVTASWGCADEVLALALAL
jgi:D-amino-acid oxidase